MSQRDQWKSKFGLILAMAGSAIGLGNFLRFPVQAAQNGGGAFMVPYIVSLLVVGVPLVWLEWTMGRRAGGHGFGTFSAMLETLWPTNAARYLGVIGIGIPILICAYYAYIASWCAGYAVFSLLDMFPANADRDSMVAFFGNYLGGDMRKVAIAFFVATVAANLYVNARGVSRGIEVLATYGIPLLFVFGVVLVVRTWTLGTPDPSKPDWSVWSGLGFIWNPNFSELGKASAWVAACGQIFFTLSLGMGVLGCYASYVPKDDDIAVSGIASGSLNEVAEVILGGSLAIPLAFAFFGPDATVEIAKGGTFALGFHSLGSIFQHLPLGTILGFLWFSLLFIAGITSSVSMTQPLISLLMDHYGVSRVRAAVLTWGYIVLIALPSIFGDGYIDELDFWAGTVGLVVCALIEALIFAYAFGVERGYALLSHGALAKIPPWIKPIWKYVTPAYLIWILARWLWNDAPAVLAMEGVAPEQRVWKWIGRAVVLGTFAMIAYALAKAPRQVDRELVKKELASL